MYLRDKRWGPLYGLNLNDMKTIHVFTYDFNVCGSGKIAVIRFKNRFKITETHKC